MMEISEEVKILYRNRRKSHNMEVTGDALRDTLARALKAEFLVRVYRGTFIHDNDPDEICECDWSDSKWQAEADRLLGDIDHE